MTPWDWMPTLGMVITIAIGFKTLSRGVKSEVVKVVERIDKQDAQFVRIWEKLGEVSEGLAFVKGKINGDPK